MRSNYTGIQLIDRNDELCILYEKANVQENILRTAKLHYREREEEIRLLRLEIKEQERSIGRHAHAGLQPVARQDPGGGVDDLHEQHAARPEPRFAAHHDRGRAAVPLDLRPVADDGDERRRPCARAHPPICVPPTVIFAILIVGQPTPTGTLCPSLPQVPTPVSSPMSLPIIATRVSTSGPLPISVAPFTG